MRIRLPSFIHSCVVLVMAGAIGQALADDIRYSLIPSGSLVSVVSNSSDNKPITINSFLMREQPVTNAEFLAFITLHPMWQRDQIAPLFADQSYMHNWLTPLVFGDQINGRQPVTSVSWFAAQAFCEQEGARLPSWYEWEYVAAADAMHRDARKDPVWRAKILAWYDKPTDLRGPKVGGPANYYGVRDMHGLIWEWVDDFNALFISPDSRNQDDPDKLKFCGAGAISLQDKENFAILMRIALLSSLSGADSTDNLGFRCVRNLSPLNKSSRPKK